MLLGWGRAILLQLAHPLIAAGVYEHSAFRARPWSAASRLHATVRAMLALTFGTDAQREHALHGIRTIHRRVNGYLETAVGPFPAGTPYSAEDPDLVLWVHLTLLDSIPLVYELFVGPMTAAERDEYCDEAAWVAIELGARPGDVPRTFAAVRAGMQQFLGSGVVAVGPQARELAAAVLSPRAGWIVPPALWVNRLITTGLLPDQVRREYGFPWDARRQAAFDRIVRGVRVLRQRAPRPIALWPEARG